jgi:transposase-like protein
MSSITLKEVLEKAACRIADEENLVYNDLGTAMASLTRVLLEAMAESEVERRAGVRLYERGETRCDYRNGKRLRTVQMSHQVLEIEIPRLRGQGFVPSFLEPNRRAIAEVEGWVTKAFLSGLNRCNVIRLFERTTECRPSDDLLRRVQVQLDSQVAAFRERPLAGRYQYLFLDAAWAKDIVGLNATRICILTAVGVTHSGEKEILGFERAGTERESAWRGFLSRLVERGLRPSDLALVISDEHNGLLSAAAEVLGDVPHQLCWAHRCRNVRKAVLAVDREAVNSGLKEVYDAKHLKDAKDAFRRWERRWQEKYPSVVQSVREDLGYLLAFYGCPELHWEYIRTSNPIERVFRELRRQQYGCGAFANRDACNRAVFRTFNWLNELWKGKDIWQPRLRKTKRNNQEAKKAA